METIWQGDVTDISRAYDLICLTNQIHKYAVNQHRSFVMEHLEAWHARHERLLLERLPPIDELDPASGEEDDLESDPVEDPDSDETDQLYDGFEPKSALALLLTIDAVFSQAQMDPEWFRLKEDSKKARARKAQAQKQHNRTLRKLIQTRGANKSRVRREGDSGAKTTKKAPTGRAKNSPGLATKTSKGSFGMTLRSGPRRT